MVWKKNKNKIKGEFRLVILTKVWVLVAGEHVSPVIHNLPKKSNQICFDACNTFLMSVGLAICQGNFCQNGSSNSRGELEQTDKIFKFLFNESTAYTSKCI